MTLNLISLGELQRLVAKTRKPLGCFLLARFTVYSEVLVSFRLPRHKVRGIILSAMPLRQLRMICSESVTNSGWPGPECESVLDVLLKAVGASASAERPCCYEFRTAFEKNASFWRGPREFPYGAALSSRDFSEGRKRQIARSSTSAA